MKLISWNVNGLRAVMTKGFLDFFKTVDADVFCLQETKMQPDQLVLDLPGYQQFFYSAEKKGYSGTAIFTKKQPMGVTYGLGIPEHDTEGRVITMELDHCYVTTVYTPNAKRGLLRLDYRMQWEESFRAYLLRLSEKKPVILCGDLNVAHTEIDLANPKTNTKNPGFTIEERTKFTMLLESGFTDTYRYLYPDQTGSYTWWSYMGQARAKNVGWRIDYFLTSNSVKEKIKEATIYSETLGSDHCPVGLAIDI